MAEENKVEFSNPNDDLVSSPSHIQNFKNIHAGKRAFILGMGPSLKIADLELLQNEITFGCNKVFLCFNQTQWRPTYYSITDRMVAKNNANIVKDLSLNKILASTCSQYFSANDNISWIRHNSRPLTDDGQMQFFFSEDVSECTYGGYTVLYFMTQVAYYMGISELYFLGVDFSFEYDLSTTTEEHCPNGILLESKGEQNHFVPNYREKNEKWVKPYLDMQESAFTKAREIFEANGRIIKNASRESKLKALDRIEFESLLK